MSSTLSEGMEEKQVSLIMCQWCSQKNEDSMQEYFDPVPIPVGILKKTHPLNTITTTGLLIFMVI